MSEVRKLARAEKRKPAEEPAHDGDDDDADEQKRMKPLDETATNIGEVSIEHHLSPMAKLVASQSAVIEVLIAANKLCQQTLADAVSATKLALAEAASASHLAVENLAKAQSAQEQQVKFLIYQQAKLVDDLKLAK